MESNKQLIIGGVSALAAFALGYLMNKPAVHKQ